MSTWLLYARIRVQPLAFDPASAIVRIRGDPSWENSIIWRKTKIKTLCKRPNTCYGKTHHSKKPPKYRHLSYKNQFLFTAPCYDTVNIVFQITMQIVLHGYACFSYKSFPPFTSHVRLLIQFNKNYKSCLLARDLLNNLWTNQLTITLGNKTKPFLAHEEEYLILIELFTLNSNM
jgi:hypothetical protein